ncbi:1-deoxy-D-xylulose-5-phosphate reductoisomerase [Alienimonas californiensis]|uniref:1-deoxy-D-xylulose-5-phosphate reductoisomerase n=1 Tax=Alienimonas californiensis TaxID=2527989 RepID=UPI001A9972B7|nr:1-deoxy-D-xylulose-5-phosphate reductoisomerase [Alienimonas californiensis]
MSVHSSRVVVLGSTGSIGTSACDVFAAREELIPLAFVAHRSWQTLAAQCRRHGVKIAVLADESVAAEVDRSAFPAGCELRFGEQAVEEVAAHPDADTVLSAIVGAAGLRGTWAAVEAGKRVALANKETLVVAGPLVTARAAETGAELLPVDSEHNAIYQALLAGRRDQVRRVILTASGGPFRGRPAESLHDVTPADALAHPTWDMGKRITIDSATMLNKAFELIEARWLFDLPADRIDVTVHPQSVVHSFVEYVDGSVLAQLSPPDMKLPIQYALTHPDRRPGPTAKFDWSRAFELTFEPPDRTAFPGLNLGTRVAERGGTAGAALNAADEVAVDRFLHGEIRFPDIARLCERALEEHPFEAEPTLAGLMEVDRWARAATQSAIV